MKRLFIILSLAGFLVSCSTTECVSGTCADVDTTIKYTPSSKDYVAQNKKQTYVSPKGSSAKKPIVVKKDTVVIVQKVVVVKEMAKKEVAPTPKPKVVKKPKAVVSGEKPNAPTVKESQMLNFDATGQRPYDPILFK